MRGTSANPSGDRVSNSPARRMSHFRVALAVLGTVLAIVAAACSTAPQTGFVVYVQSQIPLRRVVTRVYDSAGRRVSCESSALDPQRGAGALTLPASLGLMPASGAAPASGVRVVVLGYTDDVRPADECDSKRLGGAFVRSEAVTSYVPDDVRDLPMPLTLSCAKLDCPEGSTCRGGTCQSPAIDSAKLQRSVRGRVDPTGCGSVGSCTKALELDRKSACTYVVSDGIDVTTASPYVRYTFPDGTVSGAEFLTVDDYFVDAGGTEITLGDRLCAFEHGGVIHSLGVVTPCAPATTSYFCADVATKGRELLETATPGDGGAPMDATTANPDATADAARDATLPGDASPDVRDADASSDATGGDSGDATSETGSDSGASDGGEVDGASGDDGGS
ncbi:MAG: hypothetical protein U0169_27945, partial [Polyangiaceae bacterium]